MRARRGLTRFELAQALGVGLTTVDRLITFGLRSTGRRGVAKVYGLGDARRLARHLAPAQAAAGEVLMRDYRSHAEDLHDRAQRELETSVADVRWRPLWQAAVADVARFTTDWPSSLADRLGFATPEEAAAAVWADLGVKPNSSPPRRHLRPAEILELLAGDPARVPWRPAARDGIAALAERGTGVSIDEETGGWMPWDPAVGVPAAPAPPPMMRPLLEQLAEIMADCTSLRGLEAALTAPALERLPPAPETVDEARAQWRAARSAYRQIRTAVRRGHRRRAEVAAQITRSIANFRATWWRARAEIAQAAGDRDRVLALAERIRGESLGRLLSLNGMLGETARTVSVSPRRTKPRPKRRMSGKTTRRERR